MIDFVEAGPLVYLFPNITVSDVDMSIANITVSLEYCSGGPTADVLSWDNTFVQIGSIVVDYSGNQTRLYTISSLGGNPQVYTSFLQ